MKFHFNPSLSSRAANVVSLALWSQEKVIPCLKIWSITQNRVIENARKLMLPVNIEQHLLATLQATGNELHDWILRHLTLLLNGKDLEISKFLHWNSLGLIDDRKTSSLITKSGLFEEYHCYQWACVDNNVDDINYWLSSAMKFNFTQHIEQWIKNGVSDLIPKMEKDVGFWVHFLENRYLPKFKGGLFDISDRSRMMHNFNTDNRRKIFKKILFLCMEDTNKTSLFVRYLPFLLNYMSEELQIEFFLLDPVFSLTFFTKWQLQCYFFEVANKLYDALTAVEFKAFIVNLVEKIMMEECGLYMYKSLFCKFWDRSPLALKMEFLNSTIYSGVLSKLFAPNSPTETFRLLHVGPRAEEKFQDLLLNQPDVILELLCNDNKFKVFLWLLQLYFPQEQLVADYEEVLRDQTESYHQSYYGAKKIKLK